MKIAEFIAETVLRPRLVAKGCLVVYDPERRLRDLCLDMATERVCVVAAGAGSLHGRQAMQQALRELGRPAPALDGLLVYVPAHAPALVSGALHWGVPGAWVLRRATVNAKPEKVSNLSMPPAMARACQETPRRTMSSTASKLSGTS